MQAAFNAVMFALHANTDVAIAEVRRRAGGQLDPAIADLVSYLETLQQKP